MQIANGTSIDKEGLHGSKRYGIFKDKVKGSIMSQEEIDRVMKEMLEK